MIRTLGFALGVATFGALFWAFAHPGTPSAIVAVPAALAAACLGLDGAVTGSVWSRGSDVARTGAPVAFALTVASHAALVVLMALVALRA